MQTIIDKNLLDALAKVPEAKTVMEVAKLLDRFDIGEINNDPVRHYLAHWKHVSIPKVRVPIWYTVDEAEYHLPPHFNFLDYKTQVCRGIRDAFIKRQVLRLKYSKKVTRHKLAVDLDRLEQDAYTIDQAVDYARELLGKNALNHYEAGRGPLDSTVEPRVQVKTELQTHRFPHVKADTAGKHPRARYFLVLRDIDGTVRIFRPYKSEIELRIIYRIFSFTRTTKNVVSALQTVKKVFEQYHKADYASYILAGADPSDNYKDLSPTGAKHELLTRYGSLIGFDGFVRRGMLGGTQCNDLSKV